MMPKWYRSRRNLFAIFFILLLAVVYYIISGHDPLTIEASLDTTRRSVVITNSSVASLKIISALGGGKNSTVLKKLTTLSDFEMKYRDTVIKYIEDKLQEALKEDKGTGCEIPELDPFDKEVMQFDEKYPKVTCEGQDWVKCYLSECKVVPEILEITSNIQCTYRDILYVSDQYYYIGDSVLIKGDETYILRKSDHAKVSCTGQWKERYLPVKWSGHVIGYRTTAKPQKPPPGREKSYNVLILGFDSTAKNGFIRRMPKSYQVLKKELNATILDGYNIVGDGTPAALFPILTGKTELELPECRKSIKNSGHLDSMPFIFYKLKEDGYRTAYFEDMPWIGTFQYRFNGFLHQPADHYLRAFYMEEAKSVNRWLLSTESRYCIGDIPQYKLMLNITDQFFKLSGKRFGFTFIADITHDDFNWISTADDEVTDLLRSFKADGRLRDTLIIVMGDHGPRYAKVRETFQGKLEERLPLMAIVLPEDLKRSRPDAVRALQENSHVLTTPHDIYATILDVIGLTQHWNPYKVPGADLKRGLTLLEPIPHNRSCSEAGIEPHWCACLKWTNVSESDPLYERSVQALVDHINSVTGFKRSKCALRTLDSVKWVMRQRANTQMLSFDGARDHDGYVGKFSNKRVPQNKQNYQLQIVLNPGRGVYEASMTYVKSKDVFETDTRQISRTNAYGTDPSCISDTYPHLNMFCYCYDRIKKPNTYHPD